MWAGEEQVILCHRLPRRAVWTALKVWSMLRCVADNGPQRERDEDHNHDPISPQHTTASAVKPGIGFAQRGTESSCSRAILYHFQPGTSTVPFPWNLI